MDGSAADNIAYIRTYNNTMVQNWAHDANGMVDTILRTSNNHLLVGGQFTSINGSGTKYYVSLNLSTGKDDGYLNLSISGHYVYPGSGVSNTEVYNQQLSPDHGHVLAEGTFTKVRSNKRQQIFMLNLGGTRHGRARGIPDGGQRLLPRPDSRSTSSRPPGRPTDRRSTSRPTAKPWKRLGGTPSRSPGCVTRSRRSRLCAAEG